MDESTTSPQKDLVKAKALGTLIPDKGNTPGKMRRVAIKRFDPSAPAIPPPPVKNALKFGDSPEDWEFYQSALCYVIDEKALIFARKATSLASRCTWLHLGKKMPKSHMKHRFTLFEAKRFTPFIDRALREIRIHDANCLDRMDDPLPLFEGDMGRALMSHRGKNQTAFWADPHITTASLKICLNILDPNGEFEYHFLNPVSEQVREANNGWLGRGRFYA